MTKIGFDTINLGEEERDHWKVVLAAQQSRAQKRKTNRMVIIY